MKLPIPGEEPHGHGHDLLAKTEGKKFGTVLADPPWRFQNRTGKVAPEHRRLSRYGTMSFNDPFRNPGKERPHVGSGQEPGKHPGIPEAGAQQEARRTIPPIESCSPGDIELFSRGSRDGWFCWGDQSEEYSPDWATYANHSQTIK